MLAIVMKSRNPGAQMSWMKDFQTMDEKNKDRMWNRKQALDENKAG